MSTRARPTLRPALPLTAALACGVLLVSGCSSTEAEGAAEGSTSLENCGEESAYPAPVERIVATSNSANVGTLLRVGALDQLAAVTLSPGNDALMSELYGEGIEDVPRLESPVALEAVVGQDPDLLVGSYSGLFSGSSGVSREAAAERDIPTYVISDSCRQDPDDAASALGTMDPWDAVRADLENYGVLTGHEDEAAAALAELDERLEALAAAPSAPEAPEVLLFDSGETDVYTSGRNGPPQGIIEAAGAANVFDDEDTTWFRASWEAVAERSPDAIVVMDYRSDNPDEVEQKLATIRSQAALAGTDAVLQDRIVVLPLMMFTSGFPNIEAAEQLRASLEELGLLPASDVTGTIDLP